MLILKILFLFIAISYTISNLFKLLRGLPVGECQMWLMGIGITGFIVLQWLI